MKILITGFAPFGGETINPSYEAVRLLPETIGEHRITKLELPVTFEGTPALLAEKVRALNPDVLISVGQAGGRPDITLERVAINLMDARIPDNDGLFPRRIFPVEKDGETAYFTHASREKNDGSHERSRDFLPAFPTPPAPMSATPSCTPVFIWPAHEFPGYAFRLSSMFPSSRNSSRAKKEGTPAMELSMIAKGLEARHQGPVNKEIPEKPFLTWSFRDFSYCF